MQVTHAQWTGDGEAMIFRQTDGPPRYQFPHLAEFADLRHAVFTRHGGVSRGAFESLNVSHALGDPVHRVRANRQRISTVLGGRSLVCIHQVHGSEVAISEDGDSGRQREIAVADAIVTARSGMLLTVQVADCQPVLLYDPLRRVVAAVHSGWRSSLLNVIGRCVAVMQKRFGCVPSDLVAGIGPSLGPCCAEFVNYPSEIPPRLWCYKRSDNRFDFWAMSRDQLIDAGLAAGNICVSGLCTRCRTDLFFSYRGERVTGRFAAVIGIK